MSEYRNPLQEILSAVPEAPDECPNCNEEGYRDNPELCPVCHDPHANAVDVIMALIEPDPWGQAK